MEDKINLKKGDTRVRSQKILKRAKEMLDSEQYVKWLELCYNYLGEVATHSMYNHFERNIDNILQKKSTIF